MVMCIQKEECYNDFTSNNLTLKHQPQAKILPYFEEIRSFPFCNNYHP